jgi:tetratricopeptide (TPR) repeat protein
MIQAKESRQHQLKRAIVPLMALILLIAVAYGGSLGNGFVWDDETLIESNPVIRDLSRWTDYFSDPYSLSTDPVLSRMYRPLQTLSFALDAALWGDWAGGFHLTSLFLHVLCCIALVYAFQPVVGRTASIVAAGAFAVHPALSEAVLGLASRGNQLYALFGLMTVGWFVRSHRPFDRCHLLALLSLALALFSKEPAIALVGLLPLLHVVVRLPRLAGPRAALACHGSFLALATLYLAVRAAVVGPPTVLAYWGGSLWATLQMQAKVFALDWSLLLWPFPLRARYLIRSPEPFPDWTVVGAVLLTVGLIALAVAAYARGGGGRYAALAVGWFYIALAPVSNLIPIPGSMMAERFLYFPFAGVLALAAGAVLPRVRRLPRAPVLALGAVLLAVCLVTDISRTPDWRDDAGFFAVMAEQNPHDPIAQLRLAQEELSAGRVGGALARMERLSRGNPSSPFPKDRASVHYWLGRALLAADRPGEASGEFEQASQIYPSREATLFLAESLARSGSPSRAQTVLEQYLADWPDDDAALNGLGNVFWLLGDAASAARSYRRALKVNPENTEAATNLANVTGSVEP